MKVVNKTYKFRIYPNEEQEILLSKHFGCSRFVYNYFLNERKEQYQKDKKSDNYYKQAKTLTDLKLFKFIYQMCLKKVIKFSRYQRSA